MCHYTDVPGVGKVLIPGCWSVVHSNDISLCSCPRKKDRVVLLQNRVKKLQAQVQEQRELILDLLHDLKDQGLVRSKNLLKRIEKFEDESQDEKICLGR